jgi:pyridoxamine 5'-phosphate oxidase-like protein
VGKVFDGIDAKLADWIAGQQLFFVGSAPDEGGHVNVSPKGPIESLQVLDERTVAYLDLVGSGIETVAHVRQNGRICVMLCAFQGPPRVLRLHGRATVHRPADERYRDIVPRFDLTAVPAAERAARSIVEVDVDRVADSCGYDVPLMQHAGVRPQRMAWIDSKLAKSGETAIDDYVAQRNAESIDGLPGLAS